MNLYPAIDILEGQVVRLIKGDYNALTVYSNNPAEIALEWDNAGTNWIHVVDLDGARDGRLVNEDSIKSICKSVSAKVEVGGGIRTKSDIEKVLELGASRVILGTKALEKFFLKSIVSEFGDKIAVGMDVRNDKVKTAGWLRDGNISYTEAIDMFNELGVATLIYTDIEKDGVLNGPNWEKLQHVLEKSNSRIILSGGISKIDDIKRCYEMAHTRFEGVIIGKALYDKKFTLEDAVKLGQNREKGGFKNGR